MCPPGTGKRRRHLWGAFGGHFELGQTSLTDVIALQIRTPKDASPELGHSLGYQHSPQTPLVSPPAPVLSMYTAP